MKYFVFLISLLTLIACNIRENSLLPPDLAGEFYRTGNVVSEYANYLIKSSNDNAYLYLPMESIADSLIHYQDEIIFERRESFALRDSIRFSSNFSELRDTYYVGIRRNSQFIDLQADNPIMRIYTQTLPSDNAYIVVLDGYLTANPIEVGSFTGDRAWTPVYGAGEQGLYNIADTANPGIIFTNTIRTHALIASGNAQIAFDFPAEYCSNAGRIEVHQNDLSPAVQQNLSTLYPSFGLSSLPIMVSTQKATADIALIRIREPARKLFERQWIRINGTQVSAWEQGDITNPNWSVSDQDTYSFILGSGTYCFVTPLSSQNVLTLPLDGSFRQVYLDRYWFDLMDLSLNGYSMKIDLDPSLSAIEDTYLSGTPFTYNGQLESFGVTFWQGTSQVRQLPVENYIEFGYKSRFTSSTNKILMTIYRDSNEDRVTYKTPDSSYSADTFTMINGWIYASLALSGTVICGNISMSGSSFDIPYAKKIQYIQTESVNIYWNHNGTKSYTKAHIDLSSNTRLQHPWFKGEPYTPGNLSQIVDYAFYRAGNSVTDVPDEFYMALKQVPVVHDLILFEPSYPSIRVLSKSDTAGYATYTHADQILGISPTTSGKLISAVLNNPNPMTIRVYPKMNFMMGDNYLYTSGNAASGTIATLSILRRTASNDPYGIIANQYSLTQTSPVLSLTASSADFYDTFVPALYFKKQRRNEIIVYETNSGSYRFYPYQSSSTLDPWHFVSDSGFCGILPAYDGEYTSYTDNNVHSMISTQVTNAQRDHIVSLYQAQFVLPQFFITNGIPLGTRIGLVKLESVPGASSVLSAYLLNIKTAAGIDMTPEFYNILDATQEPYLYIPLDDVSQISTANLYYRSLDGVVQSLTRVENFSTDNWANEYRVVGNSFICTVNNPGWYYIR